MLLAHAMGSKGKRRAFKPILILSLMLVAQTPAAAARFTSTQHVLPLQSTDRAQPRSATVAGTDQQQQHGRSLKQFSAPGQLMAGMASEGAVRGVNKLMAATLLGNFYGSEGFGFRNYAGALPGPGGIELLALKALGAATGIGGLAAAGAATALGGPLASASTGGGNMMGLESLLPGVEVLGALKGGAKGVTKKLLKGASALLEDHSTSTSTSSSSSSSGTGLTTTTIMTEPSSSMAGSGPAAKIGALIDSIEHKRTQVRGGAVKTIGGVLTKVGQAWQAAGNKMQGTAAVPTTVVYSDMQSGTGTTYSPSSSSSSMMMPSSGGSYIMPGTTSTMGGMSNLGSNAFGSSSSGGQGVTFVGGSSGGVTGVGFGSSGGGMAGAGAGSGGLSGGNFGITAGPSGININAGVGATGTTGAGAGAVGGIPMQGGIAQPQMQGSGFSSQVMDSAGQLAGGQMQGFAPAGVISSNAPVVNPTNPNVVGGVRLESGSLGTPQQQQAAALQQQQQQQQWLQQWQLPAGAGQVNVQPQQQQQQVVQQQQMEQAQQLQAQQQLQMQQQQDQQLQAQQLQQELQQQQQLQQQQLLQQQQQQQQAALQQQQAALQQQQAQQQQQQQQQSWPLSGLNLESGSLQQQQQQQGDIPASGPYKSTDELVANALQQAAMLGAGGDWNF